MPAPIPRRLLALLAIAAVVLGGLLSLGPAIDTAVVERGAATVAVTAAVADHALPAGRRSDDGAAPTLLAVLAGVVLLLLTSSWVATRATVAAVAPRIERRLPRRRGPPPAVATA